MEAERRRENLAKQKEEEKRARKLANEEAARRAAGRVQEAEEGSMAGFEAKQEAIRQKQLE